MARTKKNSNGSSAATVGFEQKLWAATDALRNNMDAAEYKHVELTDEIPAKNAGTYHVWRGAPEFTHLSDLFPYAFEESDLGEIRKRRWAASLPGVIDINPMRPLRKGDVAPYLSMANMITRGHAKCYCQSSVQLRNALHKRRHTRGADHSVSRER